ncbi:MAG: dockerin type I domain-containing protein [Planctomycetota bacterium]
MKRRKKTFWTAQRKACVAILGGLALAVLIAAKTAFPADATFDSVLVSHADSSYKLYILTHSPDSLDSNYITGFGYEKGDHGWTMVSHESIVTDSMGYNYYGPPTFTYTEDPTYRYDVNRDGQVDIGDVVILIRYIWPRE